MGEDKRRSFASHTYASCVHLWYRSWARKCEGCRVYPLSPRIKELEEKYDKDG